MPPDAQGTDTHRDVVAGALRNLSSTQGKRTDT